MSRKNSLKTAGREFQQLVEDEIGERPKLTTCTRIIGENPPSRDVNREEYFASLFLANEEVLRKSAKERTAREDSSKRRQ